jgi:hypothetical protein
VCNLLVLKLLQHLQCFFCRWQQYQHMQTAISKNMVHSHFQLVIVIDLAKKFSEYCLLGCDAIYSGREVPAFLMKVSVQCWCRATRYHIPEPTILIITAMRTSDVRRCSLLTWGHMLH